MVSIDLCTLVDRRREPSDHTEEGVTDKGTMYILARNIVTMESGGIGHRSAPCYLHS